MRAPQKLARVSLAVVATITLAAFAILPSIRFDYEFESFFPVGDPELEFYDEFRHRFYSDNDFVLIGLENEDGIFNQDFLTRVAQLADTLATVEAIVSVQSPTEAKQLIIGPLGPIEVPYMHVDDPSRYAKDSARIYQSDHLVGSLFSTDARSVTIALQTEAFLSKERSDALVDELDEIYETFSFDGIRIAGRINGQRYFVTKMQWELVIFMSASFVLLVIFLALSFRSWWGIWVPVTVVLLAVIWLLAFMVLTGKSLDLMSVLLPTILFVVGMSDVVHILSRYLEELRNGKSKITAVTIAFKQIGMATFLTSFTTAIGFLTLLTANIEPVREFGLYTAAGVFLAFILAFLVLPAVLVLRPVPQIANRSNSQLFWNNSMRASFGWMLRNRKQVVVFSVLLVIGCLVSISTINVNNYLLEDLAKDDPHRQDFEFFEEHFTGVRPFDMAVWVADSSQTLVDYQVVRELDSLEHFLKAHYGIGFIASPLSFVRMANQAYNGGNVAYNRIPDTEQEYKRIQRLFKRYSKRPEFREFITEDLRQGRISAKVKDIGGYRMKQLNEGADTLLPKLINPDLLQYKQTGMALLIDKNNESLASNMMIGLLIAFGIIALIMGILFRSFRIVILTLIPNILPLLMIGGFMGIMGIDLKVSTSIIFTIAFGIAVDDTIHYMSKLRLELNKGKSLLYALKRTSISTGKAISVTSIILVSGFITLVLSTFTSTYYIGLLVSMTLLFAVLADLFLLPALLILFYKHEPKAG